MADPSAWTTSTCNFILEVDGVEIGTFNEVDGLTVEVESFDLEEGGQNHFAHHFPGRFSWPNLVLKRGIVNGDGLFDWLSKSSGEGFEGNGSKVERSTGAVTLVSELGERLRSWSFEGAFPVRWNGPTFVSGSNDSPSEELEIAHHGFRATTL